MINSNTTSLGPRRPKVTQTPERAYAAHVVNTRITHSVGLPFGCCYQNCAILRTLTRNSGTSEPGERLASSSAWPCNIMQLYAWKTCDASLGLSPVHLPLLMQPQQHSDALGARYGVLGVAFASRIYRWFSLTPAVSTSRCCNTKDHTHLLRTRQDTQAAD